ncbi:uncharacterized protein LOC124172787 [Ischnura elegans]|nr:uncharacterized protein LOC124172787 [Ischnura elegans]
MAERNKMRKGKKSGAGLDDIPKPTLWCYNALQFLERHSMPRQSVSNLVEVGNDNGSTSSCESPVISPFDNGSCVVAEMSSSSEGQATDFVALDKVDTPTTGSARMAKKRGQEPDIRQFLERASSALEDTKRRHTSNEHFGLFVGMELDKLDNAIVRKKAICDINNVLMNAFLEDQN